MALLTVKNKLDQEVVSDKKVGVTNVSLTFAPLESKVVNDNEVGPTMTQQLNNGILQITSTVGADDAGEGFVSALDLASANSRLALSLDAGEHIVLDQIEVRITAADTVTTDATISVGTAGPNYDDIVTEKELAQCRAQYDVWGEAVEGKNKSVQGPAEIWVNVKTPATAVELTADVYVRGHGEIA
jgi:hypothetical protein